MVQDALQPAPWGLLSDVALSRRDLAIAERRARADEIFRAAQISQQAGRLRRALMSLAPRQREVLGLLLDVLFSIVQRLTSSRGLRI